MPVARVGKLEDWFVVSVTPLKVAVPFRVKWVAGLKANALDDPVSTSTGTPLALYSYKLTVVLPVAPAWT